MQQYREASNARSILREYSEVYVRMLRISDVDAQRTAALRFD
jgi:hypothetical protein